MPKLMILGSANAVPDENHENTHLAVIGKSRGTLIDCAGNPVVRLKTAGIDMNSLTDLILTHFHPDHVTGTPTLLASMWLTGRRDLLNIYGLHDTLDRVEKMMDLFGLDQWPDFFPLRYHHLPSAPMTLALQCDEFQIYTSPVRHLLPTIGMRIVSRQMNRVIAYSCDTEPCDEVLQLADRADILIHEATGELNGHSSAAQAGEIAARAKVKSLYLIHYDPQDETIESQARTTYAGPVTRAEDFMTIDF